MIRRGRGRIQGLGRGLLVTITNPYGALSEREREEQLTYDAGDLLGDRQCPTC
jgi:hypothetical protein